MSPRRRGAAVPIEAILEAEGIELRDARSEPTAEPGTMVVERPAATQPDAKHATEAERIRAERREYQRSLGLLVEDLHARLDADVEHWKAQLRSLVSRGVPSHQHHPEFVRIASLAAMVQAAPLFHAIYDELAEQGVLDKTPRAEMEARLAEFERQRLALDLASEDEGIKRAEAAVKSRRSEFALRAKDVLKR